MQAFQVGLAVFLAGWFVVDNIQAPTNPTFQFEATGEYWFEYVGEHGALCGDSMRDITGETWYPQLRRMTGTFKFGLTEINLQAVLNGLRAVGAASGCPQQ